MNEIIKLALGFLTNVTQTTDEREQRRNLKAFKKHRKQIYKEFKKDGFTQQERESLNKLDNAYVEMTLQLGKF